MSVTRKYDSIKIRSDDLAELIIDEVTGNDDLKGVKPDGGVHKYGDGFSPFISKPDLVDTVNIDKGKFDEITDEQFFKQGIDMEVQNMEVTDYNVKLINHDGLTEITQVKIISV